VNLEQIMLYHRNHEKALIKKYSSVESYKNTVVFNDKLYKKVKRVVYGRSVAVVKRLNKLDA